VQEKIALLGAHDLYFSQNTVRVMKSRRVVWAGHVARDGENRNTYRVLLGKLKERDHLEKLGVDLTIILM
jgi:hypothetical protein